MYNYHVHKITVICLNPHAARKLGLHWHMLKNEVEKLIFNQRFSLEKSYYSHGFSSVFLIHLNCPIGLPQVFQFLQSPFGPSTYDI